MTDKWFTARKRHVPAVWPLHTFWAWPVREYFGVATTGKVLSIWDKGDYTVVYDREKTWKMLGEAVAKKILKDAGDLKGFRSLGIKSCEKVAKFCKDFAGRSADASVSEYIAFLDGLTIEHSAITKDNFHYWVIGTPWIEDRARKALAGHSKIEIEEIFKTMSVPLEISYSKKIDAELLNITDIAKKEGVQSDKVAKLVKAFSADYFWFPHEYSGPGIWDEKTRLSIIAGNIEKLGELHHETPDYKKLQAECIEKYSLSAEAICMFEILQMLSLMSDDRKRYNSEISYYVNSVVFTNLAKKLGISRSDALYLDQGLIKLSETDKELSLKRLALRVDMCIEITEDGVFSWHEGRIESEKALESLGIDLSVDKNVKEIKGQSAYKGKVTGRVRVLKTSHISDFVDGDIIVTGMTTPDFAPLIRKASAIITNEGGITCHAAIVAREMKKPCIIGTKIATQVLKTGDMVEVDANEGIVRKI
jgi:phosphohistidine swiveling domain-containing protein